MAILVCFGLVLATLFLPPLRWKVQICEYDGTIQTDWKYLGFIPYSSVSYDKSIKVSDDFWVAMRDTGIKPDPQFESKRKPEFCIRSRRLPGLDYYAYRQYEADLASLEKFYTAQNLSGGPSSGGEVFLNGVSPAGLRRQVRIRVLGPGSKSGLSKLQVSISFDVEKHDPR